VEEVVVEIMEGVLVLEDIELQLNQLLLEQQLQ
jgi:hypothetical protein